MTMGAALIIGLNTMPEVGLFLVFAGQIGFAISVGRPYWKGDNVVILTPRSVFRTLRKNTPSETPITKVENTQSDDDDDEKTAA